MVEVVSSGELQRERDYVAKRVQYEDANLQIAGSKQYIEGVRRLSQPADD